MIEESISTTGFGVDVARRRADDLEKKLLTEVKKLPGTTVLDLGCGAGGSAARLLASGAKVTGLDQFDFSPEFSELAPAQQFTQADIRAVDEIFIDEKFDYILCHRVIHYLPYPEAKALLKQLTRLTQHSLYISISGLESDLGRCYFDRDKPLSERWAKLSSEDQVKFGIVEPICLYNKKEVTGLLRESGWQIKELWISAFGNLKAIAKPK